nr:uncharacterized protein LOC114824478 [Malus domestica]
MLADLNERNNLVFKGLGARPAKVPMIAAVVGQELFKANYMTGKGRLCLEERTIKWKAPIEGTLKINFDGSVARGSAAGGFVIRYSIGRPIVARTHNLGSNTITVVDALALRDVLLFAKQRNIKDVVVEGDSKLVINGILDRCKIFWRLRTIFEDIKWLGTSFDSIQWQHVYIESNFLAMAIKSIGHNVDNICSWDGLLPSEAHQAFELLYGIRVLPGILYILIKFVS